MQLWLYNQMLFVPSWQPSCSEVGVKTHVFHSLLSLQMFFHSLVVSPPGMLTRPICPASCHSLCPREDQCRAVTMRTPQHPFTSLQDMKAYALICCLQIHIQCHIYPLPHTTLLLLVLCLQKSDREASQLAPSVPLSSYRLVAESAGLKGCHWWAMLCRTKVSMSNKSPTVQWFLMDHCSYWELILLLILSPWALGLSGLTFWQASSLWLLKMSTYSSSVTLIFRSFNLFIRTPFLLHLSFLNK